MKVLKYLIITNIVFCHTVLVYAQNNHDYNWIYRQMKLDFNTDTLKINRIDFPTVLIDNNVSINNEEGKFLGYSNGCAVFNINNDTISGTEMLNYNDYLFYDDFCINSDLGYVSGYQGMISIHRQDTIYILHEMVNFNEEDFYIYVEDLVATKLAVEEDSLSLIEREVRIVEDDTLGVAMLTAVRHSNNNDWWVIKHDLHSNCYYSILFDGSNFTTERYDCLGGVNSEGGDGGGGAVFSPQGDMYARFAPADSLNIFDFDRATGALSNAQFIDVPQTGIFGGISFSPSGQFLYVSDRLHIRQYDVWSDDIADSGVIVAEYDGFQDDSGQGTTFGHMQLAPDCRIYMITGPASPFLHVIMRPDEKGVDCQVEQHAVSLPVSHGKSMPHFPNYRLGTDQPFCDSTKVVVLNGTMPPVSTIDLVGEIKVWPNPPQDYINVLMERHSTYGVQIIDAYGKVVLDFEVKQGEFVVDVRGLASGVYFLKVRDRRSGDYFLEKVMKL